ncbi:MAG TPA: M61 family peptidase [Terriglobales bacterium]|jgi:predicted metalloprotease with PDZ domain|nr:M61 family peptidase [Terriglobales bacterium]
MHRTSHAVVCVIILLTCTFAVAQKKTATPKKSAPTITIAVDATSTPRKIFHATLHIPASAGPLTLYYPKWIPGEHGPTGPVQNLTGLKFSAGGQTLAWRRDLKDGWTFNVDVPAGQTEVVADLDFVSPGGEGIYTSGGSATEKMTVISWNTMLLYPAGYISDELTFTASVKLPEGWKFGTSLQVANQNGNQIQFAPTTLTLLVDSPVITGQYMKIVPLNSGQTPTVEMDIAADSAAALEPPQEVWEHYKNLATQAAALFGAQHYRDYHFVFSLSDHVAHFGLEHHESNDSRLGERALVDSDPRMLGAGLLPHEYVHSWNGKYRRPADLATPDYQATMQTDLLWVYEGLTSYLGDMLTARSGLLTPEQYRDSLVMIAADLDHRSGRVWRNLQDTADGVPAMQEASNAWTNWRRPLDYYDEDVLNWLWADVIIRQQTKGAKSLDDFCQLFHGAPSTGPVVKTYTFDDIVNTLNQVAPYDWRKFWTDRLTNHGPGAPLGGVEGSGWKVVYDDVRSSMVRASEGEHRSISAEYSVGLMMREDGTITDTVEDMVAAKAGIGPGMKIIAVNGRRFSEEVWRDALRSGKTSKDPLELIVENTAYYRTFKLDYHEGAKYPHLVRDDSKPDVLSEIIKAR